MSKSFEIREFLTSAEIERMAQNGVEYPRDFIEHMAAQQGQSIIWHQLLEYLDEGAERGYTGHVLDDGQQVVLVWEDKAPPVIESGEED